METNKRITILSPTYNEEENIEELISRIEKVFSQKLTNYEYESKLNDAKRSIYIISPDYLQVFLNDMKDIMRYTDSSQFIDVDLIQTENTRNTDPN